MRFNLRILVLVSLIAAHGQTAGATATQTGSRLVVDGSGGPDSIGIEVGPVPGRVTLFGVPGVPDGQIFDRVTDIAVSTFGSNDVVKMKIEATDIGVEMDTSVGNDSVTVDMKTLPGVSAATAAFAFDTSVGTDSVEIKLESFASDLALAVDFDTSISSDKVKVQVEQQVSGDVAIDLNGLTDSLELVAKGPALFTVNGVVSAQDVKVETDGDARGDLVVGGILAANKIEYKVKGSFAGSPYLSGSSVKVEIEGDAEGDAVLEGRLGSDNLEFAVKGSLAGSPRVLGKTFGDSLKLKVDGAIAGRPLVDGGPGQDSCDVSPGVGVVNCE